MKDIVDEIDSRIKSPFFGYFLFSFVAFNWAEIFYLVIDSGSVVQRIDYFRDGTSVYSLFVCPFFVASAYALLYPWLNYIFMMLSSKPSELRNILQVKSEHKLLIERGDLEMTRNENLKNKENELVDRAKRDSDLKSVTDKAIREKLESEVKQLRKERDELNDEEDRTLGGLFLSDGQRHVLEIIVENGGGMFCSEILELSKFEKRKTQRHLDTLKVSADLKGTLDDASRNFLYEITAKGRQRLTHYVDAVVSP